MHDKTTVYGKPGCVQCKYTANLMDKEGIPYSYVDITVNEQAHQEVKNLGLGDRPSLPVVVNGSQVWGGFSPDRIRGLKP